ncbi:MAG: hypothetical protein KKA10_17600 [Euryarchaeota archaeon]|nr:hypothetical protein [Euryarchaeota archaeon]MCG2738210.1 hypothetical protein [Candidatus Methanoperedenaceae archaeon]
MSRNIKRWVIALIIIIVIISTAAFFYQKSTKYPITDFWWSINDQKAKNIANTFLNNSSLTQYHVNNVTDKYRGNAIDSQVNIYNQYNNSIGWVLINGQNEQITAISINEIEIQGANYSKISTKLWKKISVSNKSSYCRCILNLMQPFSEEEKNLLAKNQKFEIHFENNTALIGVFPINKINNIINNGKIKSIDYAE